MSADYSAYDDSYLSGDMPSSSPSGSVSGSGDYSGTGSSYSGSASYEDNVPLEALVAEEDKKEEEVKGCCKKKKKKEEKKPTVGFFRMYRFATCLDRGILAWAVLMSLATGCLQPLSAVIFGDIVNGFTNTGDALVASVSKAAINMGYLGAAAMFAGFWEVAGFMWTARRQANRIRQEYFRAVMRQEIAWFDGQETASVATRGSGDVILIQEGMGEKVGSLLQYLSMFVSGFVIAFIYSWKMALVCLSVVPLLMACGAVFGTMLANFANESQEAYSKAGAVAEEVFSSIRTVMAFGGQEREKVRFGEQLVSALKAGLRKSQIAGITFGLVFLIMFGSYGLAFWYGATLIRDGELNPGDVVTCFFSILIGSMAIGQGTPNMTAIATGRGAAFEIFNVIDRQSMIDVTNDSGKKLKKYSGDISLRKVTFEYPTRKGQRILNNLSIDIEAGTTTAIVGPSGSGKSTIVQLVERFYDPDRGSVLLDGNDLKDLSLPWWRSQIGIVSQEPVLFATSIKENIRYGRLDATEKDIIEAAKMANAHQFIMKLPNGYDTGVGERGGQLSGGQKQRIAIARALIRNPKILLLDEATSALDNKAEKVVQDALDRASKGRTTIVIAHRLSTIRDADKIIVLKDGEVAEQGTHEDLYDEGGIYTNMVDLQRVRGAGGAGSSGPSTGSSGSVDSSYDESSVGDDDEVAKVLSKEEEEALKKDQEEARKKEETVSSPILRTIKLNAPEWPYILLGMIGSAASGVVFPAYALIFSELMQDIILLRGQPLIDAAIKWALVFLGLGGGTMIANYLQTTMFMISGERLTDRVRRTLFAAIIRQDVTWFDDPTHATGALATKLSTSAALVQGVAGQRIGLLFQIFATLFAGLFIAIYACWKLALVVCATVPIVMFGGVMEMQSMMGQGAKSKKAYERAGAVASETVSAIRTVAGLGREPTFIKNFEDANKAPYKLELRSSWLRGLGYAFGQAAIFGIFGLTFWYGSTLVRDGDCTIANMFKGIMAVMFGAMGAGQVVSLMPDIGKARSAASEMFALQDRKPLIDCDDNVGTKVETTDGELGLKRVVFRYAQRPNQTILKGVSINVSPGQTIALVGASGCGKSTVIQLIERFYDPEKGEVRLDGRNLNQLNVQDVRGLMALVQQEPVLFARTIRENILYGRPDATEKEMIAAAKAANLHDFVMALKDKYETQVGLKGSKLSGGQKQRVAIARALIRDPKILLLDEATSALDTKAERLVQDALDKAREGRTTVMIAHRLSTIQDADTIIAMEAGQIKEIGTHEDLMDQKGVYYQMVITRAET